MPASELAALVPKVSNWMGRGVPGVELIASWPVTFNKSQFTPAVPSTSDISNRYGSPPSHVAAFTANVPGLLPGEKTAPLLTTMPTLPALMVPTAFRRELLVNTKPLLNVLVALLRIRNSAGLTPLPTTNEPEPGLAELILACRTEVVPAK